MLVRSLHSLLSPPLFFLPADVTMDADNYTKLCTIEVDLSHISLIPRYKGNGERGQYFRLDYDLVLLFGLTELKAQVAWKEGVCVLHFLLLDFLSLRLTLTLFFLSVWQSVEKR